MSDEVSPMTVEAIQRLVVDLAVLRETTPEDELAELSELVTERVGFVPARKNSKQGEQK